MKNKSKFINKFSLDKGMLKKKGQVTIFVIIAVVVVGMIILFFAFTDVGRDIIKPILPEGSTDASNVEEQLESCIIDSEVLNTEIENILKQGGNNDPSFFFLHQSIKMSYLCYSSDYYEPCVNQQPLLLQHVENEIKKSTISTISDCVQELEKDLDRNGYEVQSDGYEVIIDITQENINIKMDYPLRIKKGESIQTFEGFEIKKPSEAYQLILVSTSIIGFEANYGDSDPVTYMSLYPNTRVEKLKQGDGTTLYRISARDTLEEFNFATRSYAQPPGYGL